MVLLHQIVYITVFKLLNDFFNQFFVYFPDFYDDKVREGAVLLSKLFGGTVENYYSSARLVDSIC